MSRTFDDRDHYDDEYPKARAGLRPDERAPGEKPDYDPAGGHNAAGTAGGGLAAGGLAGSNTGDGSPDYDDLEDAMSSGIHDHVQDRVETDEPQSGRSGGAVGGTPAGKRTRGG